LAAARARAKAEAVAAAAGGALVIGCDQVLELSGTAFDKVSTAAAAAARLRLMAGRTHYLHSAYCLYWRAPEAPGAVGALLLQERLLSTPMPMRPLSDAEIDAYVATGEWRGSVGCYQFENQGAQLFEAVSADQPTIVGLPVQDLCRELRRLGINPLLAPRGPWRLA
jgi:septum formation protein